jgi:Flp pilus assembly protein TadB
VRVARISADAARSLTAALDGTGESMEDSSRARRPLHKGGWRRGLLWRRMRLAAGVCLCIVALGVFVALLATSVGVVIALLEGVALCLVPFFGVLVAGSRYRPERRSFGGRYSDFGFLLAVLNRTPARGEAEITSRDPDSDPDDDEVGRTR